MADIDRAVEAATLRDFIAFTERHPYPSDHEPEPDLCPGCAGSVDHPLYASRYAPDVRLIGQPLTGWHIVCAEMEEQAQAEAQAAIRSEIAATLAMIPTYRAGVQQ